MTALQTLLVFAGALAAFWLLMRVSRSLLGNGLDGWLRRVGAWFWAAGDAVTFFSARREAAVAQIADHRRAAKAAVGSMELDLDLSSRCQGGQST